VSERLSKKRKLIKDTGLAFSALAILGGIANFAVSSGRRKAVLERANGKCEGCGKEIDEDETIIGHLLHYDGKDRKNWRYNSDSNVRAHCFFCEAEIHLTHIGRSEDIGLSEEDNISTVLSRIIELLKSDQDGFIRLMDEHGSFLSDELFLALYFNAPEMIEEAYNGAEKDLPIDIYESLKSLAIESKYEFIIFYFRKQDTVDFFLEDNGLELPIDLVSSLEYLLEENLEEFLRLYFGHKRKIRRIFTGSGKDLPDVKNLLANLAVEDNDELIRLIRELPVILNIIDLDLI
jgi:hypothetical protein